jgi:hypothetical protein
LDSTADFSAPAAASGPAVSVDARPSVIQTESPVPAFVQAAAASFTAAFAPPVPVAVSSPAPALSTSVSPGCKQRRVSEPRPPASLFHQQQPPGTAVCARCAVNNVFGNVVCQDNDFITASTFRPQTIYSEPQQPRLSWWRR